MGGYVCTEYLVNFSGIWGSAHSIVISRLLKGDPEEQADLELENGHDLGKKNIKLY